MRIGRLNLTVFSSALFCFGTLCAAQSQALPHKPWYVAAADRVLSYVRGDGEPALIQANAAEKSGEAVYVSRITKDDGTITVRGDVPSDTDLKILQGVAAATSPGAAFTDKSRFNASVPDRDVWLAGMTFALRQLGKLEHGVALLRNSSILIEGVTRSGDDFASVQRKLHDEAPKGIILQAAVKPHDVHPFIWVAQLQPGTLNLSGHVPDAQNQQLCSYAQGLFQSMKINNSMELAEGEPHDWFQAAKVTLELLAQLYTGSASVTDNIIRIEGIYSSPEAAALFKAYSQQLPANFRLEPHIIEPVAKAPAARGEDLSLAARTAPVTLNP